MSGGELLKDLHVFPGKGHAEQYAFVPPEDLVLLDDKRLT